MKRSLRRLIRADVLFWTADQHGRVRPVNFPERTWGQVSTEVAKGTPEDEQKSDNERHAEGDPQPSLTLLAACHMSNASSYNPNASHKQQD